MKLLIVTQKIDLEDGLLGFFHDWLIEFAQYADLILIANTIGKYQLPSNVRVFSLGKEQGRGRLYRWLRYCFLLARNLRSVDGIFFHMCPEYVLAAGILPKILGKKTALWYAHRQAGLKLKIAEKLVDKIFTPSKESFGLPSKKVEIVGHGIDINKFKVQSLPRAESRGLKFKVGGKFKIIYVGRISPIKNQRLLIEAINILVNEKNIKNISVEFIGGTVYKEDEIYLKELKSLVEKYGLSDFVKFFGSVSNRDIVKYYQLANLSVNLCPTGGLDKAVLESLACGIPVVVLNKTFEPLIEKYRDELLLGEENSEELAKKIIDIINRDQGYLEELGGYLREKVVSHSNLKKVVKRIVDEFQ